MKKQKRKLLLEVDRALSQSLWKQLGILAIVFVVLIIISYVLLAFSGLQC